jgi:iron(III) transport system substrate-binding protein
MRRPSLLSTLTLAALVSLVACAPAQSGPAGPAVSSEQHSPEVQRLITAAREAGETQLDLSYAEDNFGGAEGAKRYEALFNRMYGLNARFRFTPGLPYDRAAAQTIQEVAAGERASTDVHVGSGVHFGDLYRHGALEPYDYTQLSPRLKPEMLAPGSIAIEVATRAPGVAYNTDVVKPDEVPRKLEDVLQPKWRGKLASTPTAANLDAIAYRPEWGGERFKEFTRKLADQVGGLIRGGEVERIASGEFIMLVTMSGAHDVRPLAEKGAPLAFVVPEDAGTVGFYYLGVPRTAAHPNLAKLFVNAVLSEEGQQIMYETQYVDHMDLPGSRSAPDIANLRAKGITLLRQDVNFELSHPEKVKLKDELVNILRKTG